MEIYTVSYRKKKKASAFADAFGGEDATRTHNALRHTTFPMWLLTIRIPLHGKFTAHMLPDKIVLYSRPTKKSSVFFKYLLVFLIYMKFGVVM